MYAVHAVVAVRCPHAGACCGHSLDTIEVCLGLEEEFCITIPDEEAEKMTTPKDCIAAISAKL